MNNYIQKIVEDFNFDAITHETDNDELLIQTINDEIFEKLLKNGNRLDLLTKDEQDFYTDNVKSGYLYRYVVNDRKELESILKLNLVGDYNWLDVSKITDMSNLFEHMRRFNGDISKWNTVNVTDMHGMFQDCLRFNGDISKWNTGNVQDMSFMFADCKNFNAPITYWNTGNVYTMESMFLRCKSFKCSHLYWNTRHVHNMEKMFAETRFDGDISTWDVSSVTNMDGMFMRSFFNGDLSKWDVSSVTSMYEMFEDSDFNSDISNWDVRHVTSMGSMFKNSAFNGDISKWNTASLNDMNEMFAESVFNGDLSNFNVLKCTELRNVFYKSKFGNDSISKWDVSNVSDMTGLFAMSYVKPIWIKPWTALIKDGCIITNMFVKDETTYYKNMSYVDTIFNRKKLNESMLAFHGSPCMTIKSNTFKRGNHGYLGPGIYFSDTKDEVKRYAKKMGTGMIYTVNLDIDKILTVTTDEPVKEILNFIYKSDKIYANRLQKQSNQSYIITSADIKKLTRMGYDAIIWDFACGKEINVLNKDLIEIINTEMI